MTDDEVRRLLDVAPEERKLLYKVALCTGLRANELRNLTMDHLDVKRSGLRLDSAWTKNRKPGFQPLPKVLAEELKMFGDAKRASIVYKTLQRKCDKLEGVPEEPLLYVPTHPAREFYQDCKAAKISKFIQGEGKVDFHSCRNCYATLVIESGANLKEAQTLLRHSTPQLTMNTYARVRKGRLNEVTEKVGTMLLKDETAPKSALKQKRCAG